MRTLYGAALGLLLVAGAALAAPPEIEGPEQVEPYTIVRLTAKTDAKAGKLWKVRPADPKAKVSWGLSGAKNGSDVEWTGPPGTYTVELLVGYPGENGAFVLDAAEKTVTIGEPPVPPIPPSPPTPPGPNPPTPPTPAPEGFRVIFVYESADAMSPGQQAAMFAGPVVDYLAAKSAGWRRWDKDVNAANEKDAALKSLWEAAKPKVSAVPCVIIAVGGKAEILPLPDGADASLGLLKKYGG